ncbi:hypothetical protein TSMEX_009612 [Taenia solium]|eukprot:TsM_001102300 transcript=TsM_001102300 gene=TsM_001102300
MNAIGLTIITISQINLRPEDNNYYVCKAQSGDIWIAYAPSPENALGRLSVWFAPPKAGPPLKEGGTTRITGGDGESGWEVMYGLAHKPSRLECRSLGQPSPQWTWTGPAIRKSVDPVSAGELIEADGGYETMSSNSIVAKIAMDIWTIYHQLSSGDNFKYLTAV